MNLLRSALVRGAFAFALLGGVAACDDTPGEPTTPATIAAVGSPTVTGRAGDTLTVAVQVNTSTGRGLSGQSVTFAVASGGGSIVTPTVTTDANGQASTRWVLGRTPGAQSITATVSGLSGAATIAAQVSPGRAAAVSAVASTNNQTAAVGSTVPNAPQVRVVDASGNGVQGVQVLFTATGGGAIIGNATITTDAQGVATLGGFRLSTTAGANTLQASVLESGVSGNPVTFTFTGTAGAAARVEPGQGTTGLSAAAGSALTGASLPAVVVRDAAGNPVAGVQVTFSVVQGGGTLTGATATTNAQGVATVGGFTVGQTAGTNIVRATAGTLGSADLVINGVATAPSALQVVSGNNQSVAPGQPLQVGPSVRVVDRFGNPVAGATVTFVVTRGGGSVLGATQTTNAQGVATVGGFTLGTNPGINTIEARVNGVTAATFTAIATAGPPTELSVVGSDTASAITGRQASRAFTVQLLDAGGFPATGQTVVFSLPNGPTSGTLSATSVVTDSLGRASVTFTAGSVTGEQLVLASFGNLPQVTFRVRVGIPAVGSVTVVQGQGQSASVNSAVPLDPQVLVRDASGQPVAGVTVFFENSGQGGTVNRTTTTNAQGIASGGLWTLGATPGANYVYATVAAPGNIAGNPILFTATGVQVPAGLTVTAITGIPATATRGTTLSNVGVRVTDASGAGVPNLTVQFSVTGGGSIDGLPSCTGATANNGNNACRTTTDAQGFARVPSWTLSATAGVNSLSAVVIGGPSTTINVTAQ